jgi:hypothetical protein
MFLPNSKAETTFELNGNRVNGMLEVDANGKLKFDIQTQRSNPNQSNQFMKEMFPPRTIYNPFFYPEQAYNTQYKSPTFKMSFKETSKERRAEIALLRIAYLYAYAILGNGFLINGGLYKVREQILNPDKEILPKVFWLKVPFPKESEGINIITLPKELQSFLVIFNLKTSSQERQFAIILPGPSSPSIKVYDFISKELCVGDGTNFLNATYEHLPKHDYLKKKELTFASNWYWQEYTSEIYQPNYAPKN